MDKPLVSILIPVKDNLEYTKKCIHSIFENTSLAKTPFEILVYDNGSTDGTHEYLQGLEQSKEIKVVRSAANMGYPRANNELAKQASGEYLCLLNNDTIVTKDWLEKLLFCIRSDRELAAVGPYSNYASGSQMSPIPCAYKDDKELVGFASNFHQADTYVDFLVFFCCLIRKRVWDEFNGLDEAFTPGNFEDNYFCWQAKQKDYRLKIAGHCFIHHFESKTWTAENKRRKVDYYGDIMRRNQKIFLKKVGAYKTVDLCMIVSDREKPEDFKKFLDHIVGWVDGINIVFNYKQYPNHFKYSALKKIADSSGAVTQYVKFTDFSIARNLSLRMAKAEYVIWLDVDDK